MTSAIAVVGMACRFPDARSPVELWENVLTQRRAFRRLPSDRIRLDDYGTCDSRDRDRTYSTEAAVIEGYAFDRVRFRVAGSTFRSTDLSHWLALDVAAAALADAGFADGVGLPRESTGVVVGNTLTGEFSRAQTLRLRWPYVWRVLAAALEERGWLPSERQAFLARVEAIYKQPFPAVDEDTLAGSLSNTIAGRISNHFDLRGGGYTVDAACASSLLASITACSALASGDLDVALAGGVDLSLDPFELVGFARLGALAGDEMRVYSREPTGFWPGEGCGFVVLMREQDARAENRRVYAVIRGWGVSADGHGGLTRPEFDGQMLAVQRAYRRAGFGVGSVTYFEGHGTGTAVGDDTELRVLATARRQAATDGRPAVVGSVKALIGHTKAAAGIAALIKASMALHTQILPPTTACEPRHAEFTRNPGSLEALPQGTIWPADRALRAGVSAMGFGGINTHLVLDGESGERRCTLSPGEHILISSAQDTELFLLDGETPEVLRGLLDRLRSFAAALSRAELGDLATELARRLSGGPTRAAIVASTPAQFAERLRALAGALDAQSATLLEPSTGLFLAIGRRGPRFGFLFPGQGSPTNLDGGAWRFRFETVRELYAALAPPTGVDSRQTEVAQPAMVLASLAGLRLLDALGITATVALGHSLGELIALHWGGALDEQTLLRVARARGALMADLGSPGGAMAAIAAGAAGVRALDVDECVAFAAFNSPRQTVISGSVADITRVVEEARAQGFGASMLQVSHAFHSPLVAAVAPVLGERLAAEAFHPLKRPVISTVTGRRLEATEDLRRLLVRQITSPVMYSQALEVAAESVDLFIEVGPGRALTGITSECVTTPAIALDAGGRSLRGLLEVAGAAFVLGAPLRPEALFADRFTRPFDLDWRPKFFVNPCELAPKTVDEQTGVASPPKPEAGRQRSPGRPAEEPALELVRRLVAERAELPVPAVRDATRLLSDLHLNSIAVAQLVAEAARQLGLPAPAALTDYATATVVEVARALEEIGLRGSAERAEHGPPPGVDSWVRAFTVSLVDRPLSRRPPAGGPPDWRIIAPETDALSARLRAVFGTAGQGRSVVVRLPRHANERHVGLLLEAAHAVLAAPEGARFVLVQDGGGAGGFARTLQLEAPSITVCVVDMPSDHPEAVEWVHAEAMAAAGFTEAWYDRAGRRREPVLELLADDGERGDLPLTSADVLLVTGGGKGIAAECGIALARETGAKLLLLGRGLPEAEAELRTNLERMAAFGVTAIYQCADVTDAEAVCRAVQQGERTLGPVTAILHGAGVNVPRLIRSIDEAAALRTLGPKVQGARNVLAAVDPLQLRLFITFGSLIARTGLPGEADYALANAWLATLTERWAAEHPHCRCLAIEWSIWSGVGMGERLGRVDALMHQGITPIPPDVGVALLRDLLRRRLPAVSVVAAGRFGEPQGLKASASDLPLLRFLERPRTYYQGVELVAEAELSAETDPYLADHVFDGTPLFPAVMALEAMAQAAMALTGASAPPVFEEVSFRRPIIVSAGGRVTVRVAALVRQRGVVDVVLRSETTGFQLDHVQARCRFMPPTGGSADASSARATVEPADTVLLDPRRELYGHLLFHTGRFCRLRAYRRLHARECIAEVDAGAVADWFGPYLPQRLVLGDPGTRDAAVHAIQACVPHRRILPLGVERLELDGSDGHSPSWVHARERSCKSDTFVYDVTVADAHGRVRERWEGLRLRVVDEMANGQPWIPGFLGPYLERRVSELIPGTAVMVTIGRDRAGARCGTGALPQRFGALAPSPRRPDGKRDGADSLARSMSVSHSAGFVLTLTGVGSVGCDIEPVVARPPDLWAALLGPDRFRLASLMSDEGREDFDTAATRVWAAGECLKKAGLPPTAPLTLDSSLGDGAILLQAGSLAIVTLSVAVTPSTERLVVALAATATSMGTA